RLHSMNKQHYISEAPLASKHLSMVAMAVSTLVCCACFLLSVAIVIIGIDKALIGPLIGCLGIFGTLALACGWISIRLIRKHHAANGRSVIPEWFIQVFGFVFLIGICLTALMNGRMWLFGEAAGVALAMIGVRRLFNQGHADYGAANNPIDRSGGSAAS
ncbi:MAG: hypothetical protein ACKO9H_07785, partial [Planctomycetota bacterium]